MASDEAAETNESQTMNVASQHSGGIAERKRKSLPGVVYLSRVPPGLDVGIVRSTLGRCGRLGRVWLRPESSETVCSRRSLGGRRRSGYSDGWVEFLRMIDAVAAVELLNGHPMTGASRRGKFENDLWCMKFLKDFAWDDLVEEVCGTRRERVLRVKSEVAAARRERAFVEQRAELSKRIARKDKQNSSINAGNVSYDLESSANIGGDAFHDSYPRTQERIVRRFRQKRPVDVNGGEMVASSAVEDGGEDEEDERMGLRRIEDDEVGDIAKDELYSDAINPEFIAKLFKRRRVTRM